MLSISASIVTYDTNPKELGRVITSILSVELNVKLLIIDNSGKDTLRETCRQAGVEYIFNNENMGFGKAHNIAIKKLSESAKYQLILNPDVYFEKGAIEKLFNFMENNKDVGLTMPKVLYPDGRLQYLCRLLPTPYNLICRKISIPFLLRNNKYELKFADYDKIMDVPFLSGCFMLIRSEVFKKIGVFDERFFIYFEDLDLSRRIHKYYRTVYYPKAIAYHNYYRKSGKEWRLFKQLVSSGIKYFNKWGWFIKDKERAIINNKTLKNLCGKF